MRQLKLCADLELPVDTVTQAVGILAKRRAGKSYLARRFAEELAGAGQQIVVVDPKGDWWGIRSSANGTGNGIPIVVLGGERGDLPLSASSGAIVAKLVVHQRISVLIDLSLLRKHEVATFMTDFLEDLYRLKAVSEYRTPLMLFIDEADAIAPQKPQPNEARMLGAANDIVRRGGQRGIGCCMITQRSAVLNKDVLTQVQMLVTLRTMAPQDLAAIKAWIDVHGTVEQRGTIMESLPALPIGDAWFWSPGWPTDAGIFQRSHVLPIRTFDSGATPKAGDATVSPRLAEVDLAAVREQMASAIEAAKENDPKELRAEVKRLREQLASHPTTADSYDAQQAELLRSLFEKIDTERLEIVTGFRERLLFLERAFAQVQSDFELMHGQIATRSDTRHLFDEFLKSLRPEAPSTPEKPQRARRVKQAATPEEIAQVLPVGEAAVLSAVRGAQGGATIPLIVLETKYKKNSVITYLKRLRIRGLIQTRDGRSFATAEAFKRAPEPSPTPPRAAPPRQSSNEKPSTNLSPGEAAVLKAAFQYGSRGVSHAALAVMTGYKTRSIQNYVVSLRAHQSGPLVERCPGGISINEAGAALVPKDTKAYPTGKALIRHLIDELPSGESKALAVVFAGHPKPVKLSDVQTEIGHTVRSVQNYIVSLVARRVVKRAGPGLARIDPTVLA